MKWFWWALCVLSVFAKTSCEPTDPAVKAIEGYKGWRVATPYPIDMSPAVSYLCIGPPKWDLGDNPHVPKVFQVYVNKLGEKAMLWSGSTLFPDGTVIVKQKFSRSQLEKKSSSDLRQLKPNATPELLTVMAKQAGVWDYFVADGKGRRVARGNSNTCRSCHEENKANDYVFRSYIEDAKAPPDPYGYLKSPLTTKQHP